jgi:TPR repeat protein
MYLAGYGVTQNYKKALHYFNLAAEQGSAEAQFHLGGAVYKL